MLIKFCSKCPGQPYTTDLQIQNCPRCNSTLLMSSVSDSELEERDVLTETFSSNEESEYYDESDDFGNAEEDYSENDNTNIVETPRRTTYSTTNRGNSGEVCIVGKVSQYRIYDGKTGYRRLFPVRLYQSMAYGQRFEDVLHSFTVTDNNGRRYVVNVHGTTNYGATIVDNEKVEVTGKFTHDNILMAREVNVLNDGLVTPVKFQRAVKAIAIMWCAAILLLLGVIGLFNLGGNSAPGFFNALWSFITTMFVVYIVLLVLYVVASFTKMGFMIRLLSGGRGRGGSPLIAMLIIAFFITLLLYNAFGIGTAVSSALTGALSAVGPIIIVIIGLIILLKAIK